jgi:hypothetical protein
MHMPNDEIVVHDHPHVSQSNWKPGDTDNELTDEEWEAKYGAAFKKLITRKFLRTWKRMRTLMRIPPTNVAELLLPHISVHEVLYAGMYMQYLAMFMAKQMQWKCAECGHDILVTGSGVCMEVDGKNPESPEVTRTTEVRKVRRGARYCSDKCRQKAYRKRKTALRQEASPQPSSRNAVTEVPSKEAA